MTGSPLVVAVPSKGRLQENAAAFFARAGLVLQRGRGLRDYRGTIAGLPDVEILFLSAGEIVTQLASGAAHLGITGEDLLRESVASAEGATAIVTGLGFGHANVVVAVPQAWIDVRTMADLDEVAEEIRARHGRRLRVATKYLNLTRRFFAANGVADYRIVESLGATEGAPASGTADLIVDITTTGATLAANGLKALSRIAAEEEARTVREVRAGRGAADVAGNSSEVAALARTLGARVPAGREEGGEIVLHCPAGQVFALVEGLAALGARDVAVRSLDYLFRAENALYDRLSRRLPPPAS
jgi:ATP phosphoribosyltransferase